MAAIGLAVPTSLDISNRCRESVGVQMEAGARGVLKRGPGGNDHVGSKGSPALLVCTAVISLPSGRRELRPTRTLRRAVESTAGSDRAVSGHAPSADMCGVDRPAADSRREHLGEAELQLARTGAHRRRAAAGVRTGLHRAGDLSCGTG